MNVYGYEQDPSAGPAETDFQAMSSTGTPRQTLEDSCIELSHYTSGYTSADSALGSSGHNVLTCDPPQPQTSVHNIPVVSSAAQRHDGSLDSGTASSPGSASEEPVPIVTSTPVPAKQVRTDQTVDLNSVTKPKHSYIALISMAILSSGNDQKLLLCDIYDYIMDNFPYYKAHEKDKAWRNSVRHNLSLNECFIKDGRSDNGKGNFWAIHPACVEDFKKGDYRRRNARRRAKRGDMTSSFPQYHHNSAFTPNVTASDRGYSMYGQQAELRGYDYNQAASSEIHSNASFQPTTSPASCQRLAPADPKGHPYHPQPQDIAPAMDFHQQRYYPNVNYYNWNNN